MVTTLSLFFFISFLYFIIAGTYTRRVIVSGEVSSSPRAITLYSSVQGVVLQQFVVPGQQVKKGDTLYRIDVSRSTRHGVVSENQRKDIEKQIQHVESIISRLSASRGKTIEMLGKQRDLYASALRRSAAIVDRADEGVSYMKQNLDSYCNYQ